VITLAVRETFLYLDIRDARSSKFDRSINQACQSPAAAPPMCSMLRPASSRSGATTRSAYDLDRRSIVVAARAIQVPLGRYQDIQAPHACPCAAHAPHFVSKHPPPAPMRRSHRYAAHSNYTKLRKILYAKLLNYCSGS